MNLPGLQVSRFTAIPHDISKFDLTLSLHEESKQIVSEVEYATALFKPATIERYLGYFRNLLEAMVADDSQKVDRLPMLPQEEWQQLLYGWNDTAAEFPVGKCVHQLFEEQAARTPHAVAVVFEGEELSYAQLNTRANRLAHYLRKVGVGTGKVALLLERSIDIVVAEIAVLKCGAAYVPVDPAYSEERKAFLISDCQARAVLVYEETALPGGLSAARVDLDSEILDEEVTTDFDTPLDGEALAYVIYTSKSTGQPKGVMVPHRAITRLVWNTNYAQFTKEDRVAFAANPAFDASTLEVWAPLLNGGCIVIIGQDTL